MEATGAGVMSIVVDDVVLVFVSSDGNDDLITVMSTFLLCCWKLIVTGKDVDAYDVLPQVEEKSFASWC